jgi:branched-chain amino acid transport system ATP-binding protein
MTAPGTAPLLELDRVKLQFSGIVALDGVSMTVEKGSVHAIIGPNGAGKTSLFNCVSAIYKPTSGQVRLRARGGRSVRIDRMAPHQVAGLGVARMFQNLALFENLTVLENLLIGRHHLVRTGMLAQMLRLPAAIRSEVAHRRRVAEIIDFLHLERYRQAPVLILPYGVRKRVELGRALAMDPDLLLLDEPTSGLNQEETEEMARYVLDISEELGITQLLIEHEIRFVLDLADAITVLDFGKKIAEGTPAEVRADEAVIAAYLGAPA